MGWLSFHSRLITGFTESFPERFGPRCLIDASHIVLYITTTPVQERKTFFQFFWSGEGSQEVVAFLPEAELGWISAKKPDSRGFRMGPDAKSESGGLVPARERVGMARFPRLAAERKFLVGQNERRK